MDDPSCPTLLLLVTSIVFAEERRPSSDFEVRNLTDLTCFGHQQDQYSLVKVRDTERAFAKTANKNPLQNLSESFAVNSAMIDHAENLRNTCLRSNLFIGSLSMYVQQLELEGPCRQGYD